MWVGGPGISGLPPQKEARPTTSTESCPQPAERPMRHTRQDRRFQNEVVHRPSTSNNDSLPVVGQHVAANRSEHGCADYHEMTHGAPVDPISKSRYPHPVHALAPVPDEVWHGFSLPPYARGSRASPRSARWPQDRQATALPRVDAGRGFIEHRVRPLAGARHRLYLHGLPGRQPSFCRACARVP